MPQPIPYHRLHAQAEAWPLVSDSAFSHCTLQLNREPSTLLDKPTQALASDLEEQLRLSSAGMSLEALHQLRDSAWFLESATPEPISLAQYLHHLACRYLEPCGREVRLAERTSFAEAKRLPERAALWRWLSLSLPSDLLIAGLYSMEHREPPCEDVSLVTWQLAKILSSPVSETHLHLGATAPFSLLWTSLTRQMALSPPLESELDSGKGCPFGGAASFRHRLLTACICRVLLASYLWHFEQSGSPCSFKEFWGAPLISIAENCHWAFGAESVLRHLHRTVEYLIGSGQAEDFAARQSLYRHLVGRSCLKDCETIDEVLRRDPLSSWLGPGEGLAFPETRFTHRALRYLLRHGQDDSLFAKTFWQYQRVRGLLYQYLVERSGTAGLDWFQRHYLRISSIRKGVDKLTGEAALRYDGAGLRLGSLEVRAGPPSDWAEVRQMVQSLASSASKWRPAAGVGRPEVGLLFHFTKELTWSAAGTKYLHADPRPTGWRYGKWVSSRWRQANALAQALRNCPELLLVFRGLDVASVELAIPTWALAPLFAHVHGASKEASARLALQHPDWNVPPIRATVHAGEDFRRLMEGIRRVHEPVEFGILRRGDRIGHGLALATDPQRWAESSPVIAQPAEERLDDLIWELERYGKGDLHGDGSRREYARAEALAIAKEIYASRVEGLSVDSLIEARKLRYSPSVLRRLGYPFHIPREPAGQEPAHHILYHYLTDPGVFERGQRPKELRSTKAGIAVAQAAQAWVRRLLARLEITVETNPSSNLVIADMTTLEHHPLLNLQPLPGQSVPEGGTVLASINSDDPTTFATSLANEYSYIYLSLLRLGLCATDALRWLDRLRDIGWQSRFTLVASTAPGCLRSVAGEG